MKPFRFRLRKLKEHRERLKRERESDLARVEAELVALAARRALLDGEERRLLDEHAALRRKELTPVSESLFAAWLARLREESARLTAAREAAEARREGARAALVEASRELRVLEKLEARRRAEHDLEENRRDIRELDEVARDTPRRVQLHS